MCSPSRLRPLIALGLTIAVLTACGGSSPPLSRLRLDRAVAPAIPSGVPVQVGADSIRVLPCSEDTFRVLLDLVRSATRSVHVEMYEFGRTDLAAAIVEAHQRGVSTVVIDDASVDVTAATGASLRAAGVDVVDYPVRPRMIDHVKLLVVDGATAVVGGINWGSTSAANHDFDALVRGSAATNLDRVFERDLVTAGHPAVVPSAIPDTRVLVVATLPAAEIRPLALQLIDKARRSLDLELFVLTDTGIVHALEAAHARGVAVRVLLDPGQRPSDPSAERLRTAGVAVQLYRSHGEKLHAKMAVADGQTVLFGSANWTNSGFAHNHELDIEVTDAPEVAATFLAAMQSDWAWSA